MNAVGRCRSRPGTPSGGCHTARNEPPRREMQPDGNTCSEDTICILHDARSR
jgi:hypothetical protein